MELHVNVTGKVATYQQRGGDIVCGNSDYTIRFAFDTEWNSVADKTARFIWNGTYKDVKITNNVCSVPKLHNAEIVQVGVYGGDLHTTTSAVIGCRKSILCSDAKINSDEGKVYESICVEAAKRAEDAAKRAETVAEGGTAVSVDGAAVASLAFDSDPQEQLDELSERIADLLYTAISINSFASAPNTAEKGSTISGSLSWSLNKTPTAVTLDGVEQSVTGTSGMKLYSSITANKTWTLKATDERGATATKSATLQFVNGVYYGAAESPDAVDSAFILALTKKLSSSKVKTFTANAVDGQYIWYCLPANMGTCTFNVGGFEGGFDLVATINFTNANGYTESYYVYKSSQAGLGSTTVTVS